MPIHNNSEVLTIENPGYLYDTYFHDLSPRENLLNEICGMGSLTPDQIRYLIYRTRFIQNNSIYGALSMFETGKENKNHRQYGNKTSSTFFDEFDLLGGRNALMERFYDFSSGKFVPNPYNVKVNGNVNYITLRGKKIIEDAARVLHWSYWIKRPAEHMILRWDIRNMQLHGDFNDFDKSIIDELVNYRTKVTISYNDGDIISTFTSAKVLMGSLYGTTCKNLEDEIRTEVTKEHKMYVWLYRIKMM